MKRFIALVTCAALVLLVAGPAEARSRTVDDHDRFEVAGLSVSGATFTYGKKRVTVTIRFNYLARGADDEYQLQIRGAGGHVWKALWEPEKHAKHFVHFFWPGEEATSVRCATTWSHSFDKQRASVSFPVSCLKYHGRAAPNRVTMALVVENFGQSYLYDDVPGGNSVVGQRGPATTGWIRRG